MLKNEPLCKETEELVVSSLLTEQTAFLRVSQLLRPEMFFTPEHKEIYNCISTMTDKGAAVDFITVGNALKNNELIEKAGGMLYLAKLAGMVASTIHLETWAAMIFDSHINRQVMLATTTLFQNAKQSVLNGEDLLIEFRKRLEEIEHQIPLFNSVKDASTVIEQSRQAGLKRIEAYRKGLTYTGITSNLPELDKTLGGWQNGELIVLAARPSIGKTAVALHFARAASTSGKHTLIFSMEMNAEKLGDRFIVGQSDIHPDHWRFGNCDLNELASLETACNTLSNLPFYIDDTSQLTINQIKSSTRRLQMQGLCDMIIIDYLQLADMKTDNRYFNKQDMVSQASSEAKRIAKELNIPVILLSQLNRGLENRPGKRPELADLRDSGAIEQDADVVILIHRPEFYGLYEDRNGNSTHNRGELIIAKNRNGATGCIYFTHNTSLTKISEYKAENTTTRNKPPVTANQYQ